MTTISETLSLRGTLKGHRDWVTSLATTPEDPNLLLSSSRDKSVVVWALTHSSTGEDDSYGYARRGLRGHSHFVSDVVISSDGAFALSARYVTRSGRALLSTTFITDSTVDKSDN